MSVDMEEVKVIDDNINLYGKEESIRLKGILVIIMFWAHMFAHPERMWIGVNYKTILIIGGTPIEEILVPIFHIAVPLFFFIGGYAFWIGFGNTISFKKVRNQIFRLYQKYLLVFGTCIPICFAFGIIKFDLREFILNLIAVSSSYCGEWWFLFTYILLLIFFHFVNLIINEIDKKAKISKSMVSLIVMACSIALAVFGYGLKFMISKFGVTEQNLIYYHTYYLFIKQPFFALGYIMSRENLINSFLGIIKEKKIKYYSFMIIGIILCIIIPLCPLYKIPETFFYVIYIPLFICLYCTIDNFVGGGLRQYLCLSVKTLPICG